MAKKKGKSRKHADKNVDAVKPADSGIPQDVTEELLLEPEIIDQLRLLWAETNGEHSEPTHQDFRQMLDVIAQMHEVADSEDEYDDDEDLLNSGLENFKSEEATEFSSLLTEGSEALNAEALDVEDDIPSELLPKNYSQANDLIASLSEDLVDSENLKICLQATQVCPQLVGAWILASNYSDETSASLEYLRRAIVEAEWFYDSSTKNIEYKFQFEEEYVAATLDVTFHLWRHGLRDEVLSLHDKMESRIPFDQQGHRTIHSFRRFEQDHLERAGELNDSLLSHGGCSKTAFDLLKSLLEFKINPKSERASDSLKQVVEDNSHLAEIFLGNGYWHEVYSVDFQLGDEEEAYWIATIGGVAVRSTEGFVRWMRNTLNYVQEQSPTPDTDYKRQLQMLSSLPSEPATWILETKQLAETTFCTFIFDVNQEELLCVEADDEKPTNARLWEVFVQTMLDGQSQEPHRPTQLVLTKASLARSWQKRCKEIEIDCEYDAEAGLPEEMMEGLLDVINKVDQDVQLTDENWEKARTLTVTEEVWHVGLFQPPIWISDSATPRKSCVALVIDEESEMIRIHDLSESRPTVDYLAKTIMKGMFYPLSENMEPCLPMRLKVHPHTIPESIEVLREKLGIEIEPCDINEESLLDNAVEHLILHCSDASMRENLFDCCEITEGELRKFYSSIRDFYNASIWKWIPSDRIIEISFPNEEYEPFYVCVIGQSGFHFGVVCSNNIDNLQAMHSEEEDQFDDDSDEEDSDQSDVTFLNFGESHEIPPIDLWYIEQYDFDVASEDAYPLVQRFVADQRYRRPNRAELDQVAIATRALPHLDQSTMNKDGVTCEVDLYDQQISVRVRLSGSA